MLSAGKTGLGSRPPIVGAQINFEKGYAFLEFDHSKIATECMMFDGIILEGNTLKLRRPKDYVALPEAYKEVKGNKGRKKKPKKKKKKLIFFFLKGRRSEHSSKGQGDRQHCGFGSCWSLLNNCS